MTRDDADKLIVQTKGWRKTLDDILQEMKETQGGETRGEKTRQLSIAVTECENVIMRLGMRLKGIEQEVPEAERRAKPYPTSYDPSSPVVEPVTDGLKM